MPAKMPSAEASDIVVRRLKSADLDSVMEIEVASFTLPWTKSSYLESLQMDNSRFIGAFQGGKLLGYALCQYWPEGAEIQSIAVHPDFRKRGVAKLILSDVFVWAEKENIRRIFLQVRPSNEKALGLYNKFGFVRVGRRQHYYRDNDEDALIMVAFTKGAGGGSR